MSDNPAYYSAPSLAQAQALAQAQSSSAHRMLGSDGRENPNTNPNNTSNLNLNLNRNHILPGFANFTQNSNAAYQFGASAGVPAATNPAAAMLPHLPNGVNPQSRTPAYPQHTPHYGMHQHAHPQQMYHHQPPPPPPQTDQWAYNSTNGQVAHQNSNRAAHAYSSNPQFRSQQQRPNNIYSSTVSSGTNAYHPSSAYASTAGSHANSARGQRHVSTQGKTRLESYKSVIDGLGRFRDESHIIMRFSQFLAESNRQLTPSRRRQVIHQFSGFPRESHPRVNILCQLSKSDLEALANCLGIKYQGRKIDVATRITAALMEPLFSKQSTQTGHSSSGRPANGTYGVSSQSNTHYHRSALPSTPAVQQQRANMPMMPANASHAYKRQVPRFGSRHISSESDLMHPETPFNLPRSYPLPNPDRRSNPWTVFAAHELNASGKQIVFQTPNLEDFEQDVKGAGEVQVHLRCLKLEASKPPATWKQCWPFPTSATVNANMVELDQAQRFTNGKLAGRDKGTNITRYLYGKRTSNRPNVVILRRTSNSSAASTGTFVLFAQVVLVRSSSDMKRLVQDNSLKYWNAYRRAEIAKGMNADTSNFELSRRKVQEVMGDDDVAVESQKVNLRCPLSLVPIDIPVRGKDCTHIQCFDLASYLDYTRRSSKFNCPVCSNKDCTPDSLVISWYMQHALKEHGNCDEIEVLKDGSIKPVELARNGVASADSDDDDFDEPASKRRRTNGNGGGGSSKSGASKAVVVDLTLDDSDDESPTPAPATANQQAQAQSGTMRQLNQLIQAAGAGRSTSTSTLRRREQPAASFAAITPAPTPSVAPPPVPLAVARSNTELRAEPGPRSPTPPRTADTEDPPWINYDDGAGDEGELFDATFTAEDRLYPWDMGKKSDSDDEDAEAKNDGDEGKEAEEESQRLIAESAQGLEQDSVQTSGQTFENGVEVICLDD